MSPQFPLATRIEVLIPDIQTSGVPEVVGVQFSVTLILGYLQGIIRLLLLNIGVAETSGLCE
jgi:hypothetical protein